MNASSSFRKIKQNLLLFRVFLVFVLCLVRLPVHLEGYKFLPFSRPVLAFFISLLLLYTSITLHFNLLSNIAVMSDNTQQNMATASVVATPNGSSGATVPNGSETVAGPSRTAARICSSEATAGPSRAAEPNGSSETVAGPSSAAAPNGSSEANEHNAYTGPCIVSSTPPTDSRDKGKGRAETEPVSYHYANVRPDRLQEPPSSENAQGLFPPRACVFVGK